MSALPYNRYDHAPVLVMYKDDLIDQEELNRLDEADELQLQEPWIEDMLQPLIVKD